MALSPISASMFSDRLSGRMKVMTGMNSDGFECDGRTFQTTERVVVAALYGTGDLNGGDLSCQCRQHRLTFQARGQPADAHMNARTQADLTPRRARDVVTT